MSRRHFLWQSGAGLGGIALAWLLNEEARAAAAVGGAASPYAPKPTHFPARIKRIIHVCALGGVSHIDTFDYKPGLVKYHGQELTDGRFVTHREKPGTVRKCPWEFRQRGACGRWVSDLLPHLATCVDDMTFIHSMHTPNSNHTPATFLMNSGFQMNGFPSMGAWLSYGLGSENQNLPAYIVLPDPRQHPSGGAINWTAGFLPAAHQGVAFNSTGEPIADLYTPKDVSPAKRWASLALLAKMNTEFSAANPGDSTLAARIRSYELAAQMQLSVPDITNLDGESEATRKLYGLDSPTAGAFGRNCLLARRLSERGVRFVQVFNGGAQGSPRVNWDAHEDLEDNHTKQAATMDQPVAGLLKDLKARGLLEDTLLLWTTEFGRTPITEGRNGKGRDHHQFAFTIWMAGAGVKPGFALGASDDLGNHAVDNPVEFYDIHATVLRLLGLDHERLTYYHNGIQRRLTDVHGRVLPELLA